MDIGTNSTRLLVVSAEGEVGRWQTVTGLGRGLGERGLLTEDSMARTLAALMRYGELMAEHGVAARRAVATSAVRDALNRDAFLDRAAEALGVRPENISGEEEARLSFRRGGLGPLRPSQLDGGGHRWGLDGVRLEEPGRERGGGEPPTRLGASHRIGPARPAPLTRPDAGGLLRDQGEAERRRSAFPAQGGGRGGHVDQPGGDRTWVGQLRPRPGSSLDPSPPPNWRSWCRTWPE